MKTPILMILAAAPMVFANGGGYFRGGVEHTGDVAGFEPTGTAKVRIVDELLRVRLGKKAADVEVRYLMKNTSDDSAKVRFGFPVEESRSVGLAELGLATEEKPDRNPSLQYCGNYRIVAGGKPLEATWKGEWNKDEDQRFKSVAGWLISEMKFKGGEEKVVRITFRSDYPDEHWGVSDDSFAGAAVFRYRLSTGAVWGGTIASGRIELIPAGADAGELRVLKPVNRFRKDGEKWVWDFENLEPTLADDLEVEVRPAESTYWRYEDDSREGPPVLYHERRGKWTMSHANYEARASSTLAPQGDKSYGVEKLQEWSGAWSEGAEGPGVGEWIEVKPKVAKRLQSIELWPGYQEGEELFRANARPGKVEVLLNGEHRIESDVPDEMGRHRILVRGYAKPVHTARLTIKEVWPGKRFEDLCISKLSLEVATKEKPEITPSR